MDEDVSEIVFINEEIAIKLHKGLMQTNLFEKSQSDLLLAILKSKEVNKKVLFRGNVNRLVELFKRLKKSSLTNFTNDSIAKYTSENFSFLNSNNEVSDIKFNTARQILSKPEKEPSTEKKLLLDQFPEKTSKK